MSDLFGELGLQEQETAVLAEIGGELSNAAAAAPN